MGKMTPKQLSELGLIIDRACDNNNQQSLCEIIKCNSEIVETLDDSVIKATLYYFLAIAWSKLRDIRHKDDKSYIWNYEQDEINYEIIYLRKAKKQKDFTKLSKEYQCSILTNLANIFSHVGRTVYALMLYNQAVQIEKNFYMARGNRGICLLWYARLDYDKNHKYIFVKNAYDNLRASLNYLDHCIENNFYADEHRKDKYRFQKEIEDIETRVNQKDLEVALELDNFSFGETQEEQDYRKWALVNTLFLNPMNDIGSHSIAAHDPLSLPNIISEINSGFPKYITYFNQMKQEYISYRHLLYEGLREKTNEFYDKDTVLIDDYDYNLYDINTEKIKLAFRGFYSIFDKIAYFLNAYFDLQYNIDTLDFRKIWKNKHNQKELNTQFYGLNNLALRGLYFINKDLFFPNQDEKSFVNVVEPEAEEINNIRNHLEHKFLNIKMLDCSDREIKYITIDELNAKTLHLARLAREAMIYLSFTVHIEENKKNREGLYMPILMNTLNENRR